MSFLTAFSYSEIEPYVLDYMPLVFFGLIAYFMWRTLKMMPKTKPQEITSKSKTPVTFADVAGVDETKDELQEIVEFLSDPKRFKRLGATTPKGILLHGPPGTGKTLLAKAVAHESGATFLSQSASSFIEMFAGLGAARIRRLFNEARDNAPAIVFIDELDAVGAHRGSDVSGERDQTLNQLLVEMDGFNSRDDVIVMAASNMLDKLDKALLRPGRFDRQVFVPPPDMKGRVAILEVHTKKKPLAQGVELERVARHGAGLTGADLANLANEAAIMAARSGREFIVQADFDDALERVVAGLESRKVISDQEKKVVAWHEAGHAVASELLPTVDKVQKVSIVPRGKALGYTLNLPHEDRYLKSRGELIDYMKVLLAGRVAEQITFGRVTTGASDDLKRVTHIARSMVYEYAMGTQIRSHQLPIDDFTLSESTRQVRDEEVQAIAEEAYRGAHTLLSDHRDLLDEVAERLIENEVIEREEIQAIMRTHREANGSTPATDPVDALSREPAIAAEAPADPAEG